MSGVVEHTYVRSIPEQLASNTLYVSRKYDLVVHLCMCGCGSRVVTPLGPAEWSLREHAGKITLWPSIASSGQTCRSHYLITNSEVRWLPRLTSGQQYRAFVRDERDLAVDLERARPWWRRWWPSITPRGRRLRVGALRRRWNTVGIGGFVDHDSLRGTPSTRSTPVFLLAPAAKRALAWRVATTSVALVWLLASAATFWWSAVDLSATPSWLAPVVAGLTVTLATLFGVDQAVRPSRRPFSADTRRW